MTLTLGKYEVFVTCNAHAKYQAYTFQHYSEFA